VADATGARAVERLEPGTRVEVRRRFDQHWSRGFEVVAAVEGGYRLKRQSDGTELPVVLDEDEVRVEKKKSGLWWY
jgi:hypothetical protein